MRKLGVAAGITIRAPLDAYFSFHNSPYTGHKMGTSVDIYPSHQEWGGYAYSPVEGIVTRIKKITMGRSLGFQANEHDYGIGIRPEGFVDKIVRILHCTPTVSEGDSVEAGDTIGTLIRSRYFNYWTGPHYHTEIMNETDFLKASRSFPLISNFPKIESDDNGKSSTEFQCEVSKVVEDYMIVFPSSPSYARYKDLHGHLAVGEDQSVIGFVDAGFPQYSHGGIVCSSNNIEYSGGILFRKWDLGPFDTMISNRISFATARNSGVLVQDVPIRGISFFIYPRNYISKGRVPLVLIPQSQGEFMNDFEVGEMVMLRATQPSLVH